IQASYTRSKTLGEYDGNQQSEVTSFITLRNEHLDKRLVSFDVPNLWRTSGIWDLPFGPHRKWLGSSHGILAHVVEKWQTAFILNKLSGTPGIFGGTAATFNALGDSTYVTNGPLPKGDVHVVGNSVLYFPIVDSVHGVTSGFTQVPDPSIKNLPTSTLQS